ncbi:MAG TPA: SDR family NAD(P)-dependent oxidoreductase [Myxococcota bacterium]|nr:SDR family NAD(P)-dependent oxidoreductase [Myxococcota bacterium]
MKIAGKVAVVTGGASGIGLGSCREFVARGGRVVLFDVQEERAKEAVRELGEEHAHFVTVDVSDADQVERGMRSALERFGAVHAVLNAAGVPHAAKIVADDGTPFPSELWSRTLAVNLTGTFHVTRFAAAAMLKNAPDEEGERGVIVNVSSGAAWQGQMGQAAYSATKAGVIGMVLPAARDLAKHGIRVLAIAPGLIDTGMLAGLPEKALAGLAKLPLFPKRLGRPREVGALFCSIVEIPYLNATCLSLDAGARM